MVLPALLSSPRHHAGFSAICTVGLSCTPNDVICSTQFFSLSHLCPSLLSFNFYFSFEFIILFILFFYFDRQGQSIDRSRNTGLSSWTQPSTRCVLSEESLNFFEPCFCFFPCKIKCIRQGDTQRTFQPSSLLVL